MQTMDSKQTKTMKNLKKRLLNDIQDVRSEIINISRELEDKQSKLTVLQTEVECVKSVIKMRKVEKVKEQEVLKEEVQEEEVQKEEEVVFKDEDEEYLPPDEEEGEEYEGDEEYVPENEKVLEPSFQTSYRIITRSRSQKR